MARSSCVPWWSFWESGDKFMTNRRKRGHLGHPVLKHPDLYSTCCALARTRIGEESKTIKQTRSSFDKNIFSRTKPSGYTDSVFPPLERSLDDGTLFFCMKPILSCARIYLVIVGSASWEWKLRRSVFPPRIRGEWGMGNGDIWIQVCWKWIGFYFLDFFFWKPLGAQFLCPFLYPVIIL